MTTKTMNAAISPLDRLAGLLSDDGENVQVLDHATGEVRSHSKDAYLLRHPDTLIVEVRDVQHASEVLKDRSAMSACLDMVLLLFDCEVSLETRIELAEVLNAQLEDDAKRRYVEDIVLSRPLSPAADADGAIEASKRWATTQEFVSSLINCQDRSRTVFESWLIISQDQVVEQNGAENVYVLLSKHGVFRRLAHHAVSQAELGAITPELAMDSGLKADLDASPRIVQALVQQIGQKLPAGEKKQTAIELQREADYSLSDTKQFEDATPQHSSVHEAYNAAVSQVDKISDLYRQSKDPQAEAILRELVAEQRKETANHNHLVKSLCNIATQVQGFGRPEISFECLNQALDFPKGIDSILYFKIATGLRDVRRYEEALECFDRAAKIDNGTLSERILREKLRIGVAKGFYEDARRDYLNLIPYLQFKAAGFSDLGTLYRKMGCFREAREAYWASIQHEERYHNAYAGLAEIRKQRGKPHQAIAKYNLLLNNFQDLEVGSRKVYQLARSHLFRLTTQYNKAEEILLDLRKDYPSDRSVHLEFAKLLALRGDIDQAQKHFEKARGPSLRELGDLVFANVRSTVDTAMLREGLSNIKQSILPEDSGLASCVEAYSMIQTEEYEDVPKILSEVKVVDRLVGDLSEVLCFHALRRVDHRFDYKSSHSMCRVAKQSDRSLRRAMQAIKDDRYDEAFALEGEILLRIAV